MMRVYLETKFGVKGERMTIQELKTALKENEEALAKVEAGQSMADLIAARVEILKSLVSEQDKELKKAA